jgi:uncharacterized protein (DUF2267 family)
MNRENLLLRIEQRARLHGPNETRRAVCATLEALGGILPPPVLHPLLTAVPAEIRQHLPAAQVPKIRCCRDFITVIAGRLQIEAPDAAFLARVVFEQLNDPAYEVTPAAVAHLTPADLRPLLSARDPELLTRHPATDPSPRVPELGAIIEFPRPARDQEAARELHSV